MNNAIEILEQALDYDSAEGLDDWDAREAFGEAVTQALAALIDGNPWRPISECPALRPVWVHYRNRQGKSRIVKAAFIPRFTEVSGGGGEEHDEYCEALDEYTYCEGWYEQIDNWDDFAAVFIHEGKPDAWMPLPPAPGATAGFCNAMQPAPGKALLCGRSAGHSGAHRALGSGGRSIFWNDSDGEVTA